jgi:holliday junction DNA helicase RuvA
MIGKLKGLIDSVGEDALIVDVNGVGYVVAASARTLRHLPAVGQAATLHIETQVREDAIRLFGFRTDQEREWFRLLQTVQGVGSKVALGILSVLDPGGLATALGTQDKAMIARAPGVGPKLAARIVSELKDKAPALGSLDPLIVRVAGDLDEARAPKPVSDAVSALVNLGYAQAQAATAVAAALRIAGESAEAPQLIRLGLKEMAK